MSQCEWHEPWQEEADVVIVGSGFAGLAAAIKARIAGASVIILEKMKAPGGNSIISDGCPVAAGSPLQEKDGIKDSPELLYQDMMRAGLGLNHPDLVREVAERSNEAVQWTIEYLGVKYQGHVLPFGGHSVPRSYAPQNLSGAAILKPQLAKVKELGAELKTRAYLEKLLRGSDGSLKGVRIREGYTFPDEDSGTPKSIKAKKAVILATGGFGNDVRFRSIQDPRLTREVESTNRQGATAEALMEAMRIGAVPVQLSWIQLGPWASPDERMYGVGPLFATYVAFPYGVMVDPSTGRRIVNEMADRKTRADAILSVGRPCIGIADSAGVTQSGQQIDKCTKRGVVRAFDALQELAKAYDIPPDVLVKTVNRYNGYVRKGKDDEFGKPIPAGAMPLSHPPYYGIRLWPKVHYTMGGIQINTKAQVMGLNGRPIKRFYAAGEVTGGIHGACRLGSLAITDCLVFGRIAGKNAAAEEPWS